MSLRSGISSFLSRPSLGIVRSLSLCALLAATSLFLLAQGGGGSGGTGGGGGGGSGAGGSQPGGGSFPGSGGSPGRGGQPGSQGSPGMDNDPFGRSPDRYRQRPFYLTGKVVLDSGDPAPIETVIERVCHGQVIPEGFVNSKGEFNLELGRNAQILSDASTSSWGHLNNSRNPAGLGGMGGIGGAVNEREFMGCEIRATLPGYRSNVVPLAGRRSLDNPDIGTFVLTRLAKVEGFTISATTLNAPKNAKRDYERGTKELKNSKFDKAIPHLEKALAQYPQYAVAWYALGQAQEGLKDLEKAEESYNKAIEADSRYLSPYLQLATLAANRQDWQKTEEYSSRTIRMNPVDFPLAYYLNALGNLQLQQFEKAEESAREAKKMDSGNRINQLDYFLAVILANQAKYDEAATFMRSYIEAQPEGADTGALREQLGRIENRALAANGGGSANQ